MIKFPEYKREDKLSSKLSEEDIFEMQSLKLSGVTLKEIAKKFNVSTRTVSLQTLSDEKKKEYYRKKYIYYKERGIDRKYMNEKQIISKNRKAILQPEVKEYSAHILEEWRKNNPDKVDDYMTKNRKKINKSSLESYHRNKEHNIEKRDKYAKEYFLKNKDIVNKKNLDNYYKNKEKILQRKRELYKLKKQNE